MISIKKLSYEYPNSLALDNIDLEIPDLSITALVGPNGAGKTTLLHCLSALSRPFAGEISIDGIDIITNPLEAKKIIGYLPDFFGLYDQLSIYENLEYFAYAHKLDDRFDKSQIKNRIKDVIHLLNLEDKTNEKVSHLSRGMRQRVGIAQSIIHSPKLLLLDEPASGLDPEARIELSKLLLKLNSEGMTLIVSSHILAELNEYANNLIVIGKGKIIQASSVESLNLNIKELLVKITNLSDIDLAILRHCKEIEKITQENNTITLQYDGNENSKSTILKFLFENNIQVSEFSEKKSDIQEQYLELMKSNKNIIRDKI
jgi:ABC-2 type transport system ATP-binding protein